MSFLPSCRDLNASIYQYLSILTKFCQYINFDRFLSIFFNLILPFKSYPLFQPPPHDCIIFYTLLNFPPHLSLCRITWLYQNPKKHSEMCAGTGGFRSEFPIAVLVQRSDFVQKDLKIRPLPKIGLN